jgi:hypothetical protein
MRRLADTQIPDLATVQKDKSPTSPRGGKMVKYYRSSRIGIALANAQIKRDLYGII